MLWTKSYSSPFRALLFLPGILSILYLHILLASYNTVAYNAVAASSVEIEMNRDEIEMKHYEYQQHQQYSDIGNEQNMNIKIDTTTNAANTNARNESLSFQSFQTYNENQQMKELDDVPKIKENIKIKQVPPMPLQFHAKVHLYAHQLPRNNTYPSYKTKMDISYDYPLQRVKCVIHEGVNKGKVYLRRYDEKVEYMIKRKKKVNEKHDIERYIYEGGEETVEHRLKEKNPDAKRFTKCIRSYLGEKMPKFELKHSALKNNEINFIYQRTGPLASMENVLLDEEDDKQYYLNRQKIKNNMNGDTLTASDNADDPTLVDYYTTSDEDNPYNRYDLYISTHTQLPQRIVDFSINPKTKQEKMIMTYNFVHISTPQFPISSPDVSFNQCKDTTNTCNDDINNNNNLFSTSISELELDEDYIHDAKFSHLPSTKIYDIEQYGFEFENCEWHVGGFPYIHAFLYFLRF